MKEIDHIENNIEEAYFELVHLIGNNQASRYLLELMREVDERIQSGEF